MTVFVAGTSTFFNQTTAPTGWTKSTTYDDATLRVVSGSASSGGSLNLSSVLTSGTWGGTITTPGFTSGGTALTLQTIPNHNHLQTGAGPEATRSASPASAALRFNYRAGGPVNAGVTTTSSGNSDTHSHTSQSQPVPFTGASYNFAVNYVDVIMATKNS